MELDAWSTGHHGLITRDATGWSDDAWHRALRRGHLEPVHPLVARLPGTPRTREQRILAALLAAGPQVVASHRSAAYLWGCARPDGEPVDLLAPRGVAQRRLAGVDLHRPADRARLIPQLRSGIRCTNPLRTLLDLAALDPESMVDAVGTMLGAGFLSLEAIEAAAAQHSRQGRKGIPAVRRAIDEWTIDRKPADSKLEAAMRALVERFRLPAVEFHPRIGRWEPDFRVVGTAILLECDGWADHGLRRGQFERDRKKDAELGATGWIVVRFTYRAIVRDAARTADRIRRNIDRWGLLAPPDHAAGISGG